MVFIYRQEILKDISLFTSQPKAKFYDELFINLDLSCIPAQNSKFGRASYSNRSMICAFIVMKCEGFSQISDLHDYLSNNLIIAHYCGFDISRELPSYAKFTRFIREFDNDILQTVMQSQVLKAADLSLIDSSFIALDATPVKANVSNNNPKSFKKNKFSKASHPKSDKDCRLGVQTASNQHNEKNYEFYWGYKNHILVDCISGLPVCELTTGANVSDSSVTLEILKRANSYLPMSECSFLADKAYDVKTIYNTVHDTYNGDCFIALNKRNTKSPKKLPSGNIICEAGLAMHKDGKFSDSGRTRQKYCCPLKRSKNGNCPCNHKCWNNGKKNRGCTKYVTISDDYRLSIDRSSIAFKSVYALRTEAERYNSRFKQAGCESVFVRNGNSVKNLNTIAHISLLSITIAAVITKKDVSYRSVKTLKRLT